MKTITATEFKAKCLAILDDVERTGDRVGVTKRGRLVAEIGPVRKSRARYPQDSLRGSVTFCGDIISPPLPPDAWDAERRE